MMPTIELPLRRLAVIGGVPVDILTIPETLDRVEAFIESRQPHQIATVNVDFIVKAQDDPELMRILQGADLLTADGMSVVWGSRLLGVPLSERVAGSDLVPLLAEQGAKKGWRFFFLGAAPGVAAKAAEILTERYPGLQVVGTCSPPITTVYDMPADAMNLICEARPDILLVAFGNPKQEKWIYKHLHSLNVPVAMGVGGTLDFITGNQRRAPRWMQMTGTEWLHRFLQDPKRMWRRYTVGMVRYIAVFIRQWWRQALARISYQQEPHASRLKPAVQVKSKEGDDTLDVILINSGPLTGDSSEILSAQVQSVLLSKQLQGCQPMFFFPMGDVKYIDSAGLGALVQMTKQARAAGGNLRLEGVHPPVQKTIEELKLDRFLTLGNSSCTDEERYPSSSS